MRMFTLDGATTTRQYCDSHGTHVVKDATSDHADRSEPPPFQLPFTPHVEPSISLMGRHRHCADLPAIRVTGADPKLAGSALGRWLNGRQIREFGACQDAG